MRQREKGQQAARPCPTRAGMSGRGYPAETRAAECRWSPNKTLKLLACAPSSSPRRPPTPRRRPCSTDNDNDNRRSAMTRTQCSEGSNR